ncbi:MAG: outer membrane beta-barrel protein [Nonlabens sp.]|uniref:outer membrane beta-barrel protein n=1 Tax=Nonlabens sp. TaxID=1888209 RepID=UPI003EF956DE
MKNLFIAIILLFATVSQAQTDGGFGLKAGLNYGSNGDLRQNGQTIIDDPDANFGYHVGLFGKVDLGAFYLRPELSYTVLNSEYDSSALEVKKLDAPVLVGFHIAGPLHVFAGPSFQYILDTELENVELQDVKEDFTIGMQVGIGVDLGNLGIDVRYERGLSSNEAEFTNLGQLGTLDTRPQQIIVGLSLKL